jgi:long-chain acyl-CoA synthetase
VDPEDSSREVPPGQAGELAVRGPQVFLGYWKDAQDPLTDDDWFLTGDVVVMDDDGFFTVVDRKKELVIVGGLNVYPSEVEQVVRSLPGVEDVAVVGVEDDRHVETVTAFVVVAAGSALTEQDVVEHCRAELSAYKVPRVVRFRDALPKSPVGKVQRRALVDHERAALRKTGTSA